MRPVVTDGVAWSVCRPVCHDREPCKTAASKIEIRLGFGLVDTDRHKEPRVRWTPHPHANGQF